MMSGPIRGVQDLIAWQRGLDLVVLVYQLSAKWPPTEMYGLTNQARRAAVSIPSNIAEGQGRGSAKEFARFISIARGSLRELETQFLIALRLCFHTRPEHERVQQLIDEIGRLLQGLSRKLATLK